MQTYLWDIPGDPSDVVYTPRAISKGIIDFLSPNGLCLDPCAGDGVFFDFLPKGSLWCEIEKGKDFLLFDGKVDWVIGNPPYSIFEEFLLKAFDISDNVSFLVPTNKVFQRQLIMDRIGRYGGIKSILIYGSGQTIGFPFGFSVGNFHFKKDWSGETKIVLGNNAISKIN